MANSDPRTQAAGSAAGEGGGPRLVSFVLPVLDEQATLEELYEKIVEVMATVPDDYELLFVDDGSTDGSFEVLRQLHQRDPKVRVIRLRRNFGKSAAYSAGFDHARGDIVITMDTDLQDDPTEIPLFLKKRFLFGRIFLNMRPVLKL